MQKYAYAACLLDRKIFFFLLFLFFISGHRCLYAEEEWKEHKSEHFIIYHKKAPKDFVESVDKMAEDYYDEISKNLGFTRYKGWTWDARAKIYIYNDADDYVQSAKAQSWSHGVASPEDKVIRTFPSAHGFFDSTLPHELGHIIFREFIGFNAPIPLWMEEGVAMYQEKAKRWGSNEAVREAMKNGVFIPLQELPTLSLSSRTDPNLVNLFYAEAASAVYFMITELGEYRFVNFCRKLQDGSSFEGAMAAVYVRFKTAEQLNKAWVDYLNND